MKEYIGIKKEEGTSKNNSDESTSENTPESTSHWSQYSIKNNKKNNNIGTISEEKREEFEKVWNTRLTGTARLF